MSAEDLWVPALFLFAGAALQAFLGFGFGIVAMGGLAVSLGLLRASGIVNVCAFFQVAWLAWMLREHVRWRFVARLAPGTVVGILLGLTALRSFDATLLLRALGVVIVAIALWNLLVPHRTSEGSLFWDAVVGLTSGMIGGAFNTGGPPIVAYLYQRPDDPIVLKATIQITFLAFTTFRLAVALGLGIIDGPILREALLGVPVVLAGAATGLALGRRISADRFRTASWIALAVLGVWIAVGA